MREPARVHLPVAAWPEPDQAAWADLFREGDILSGRGAAWHWSPATRATNAQHYGRWLSWVRATGQLRSELAPWSRVTEPSVRGYLTSLRGRLAPRTVASALIGLKCVMKAMRPEGDWRWLMDLSNRYDSWAVPAVDRSGRILAAGQVFQDACAELERLAGRPLETRNLIAYRDVLVVALLTACPVRMRNLVSIRIGEHLHRAGRDWRLSFSEAETKTRHPVSYIVPPTLARWLEFYLEHVRPRFPMQPGCRHLWVGWEGRPLAPETHYDRIMKTTKRLFGVAINPHSFRTIAATALADASDEGRLHAAALLGHRRPVTTDQHYIKPNQLDAGRRVNAILLQVRDNTPGRRGS